MFGREKEKAAAVPTPVSLTSVSIPQQGPPTTAKIETVIGANCHMKGTLQSDGGIRIEGIVEGTVDTTGNMVVADGATVFAELRAYNITISGQVKGNIVANRVEITGTGRVWGDLQINSMLLHEGAFLKGQTNMSNDITPPQLEPARPGAKAITPKREKVVEPEPVSAN
jgi:cytoskeletal protein CcmA (bactofilin family)